MNHLSSKNSILRVYIMYLSSLYGEFNNQNQNSPLQDNTRVRLQCGFIVNKYICKTKR